jgi:hypothetical protein
MNIPKPKELFDDEAFIKEKSLQTSVVFLSKPEQDKLIELLNKYFDLSQDLIQLAESANLIK